jgi:hypothetical protein
VVINSRRMRGVGHVARLSKSSRAYTILVGKPEVKSCRWRGEDNIKTYLKEMDFGQDSYGSSNISSGYVRAGEIFEQISSYWIVEKVYFCVVSI